MGRAEAALREHGNNAEGSVPGGDKLMANVNGKSNITLPFQNTEHWNETISYLGILITH